MGRLSSGRHNQFYYLILFYEKISISVFGSVFYNVIADVHERCSGSCIE